MKPFSPIAIAALALSLAACGEKSADNASAPAGPPAAVAAPAGTTWADTVAETPEHGFRMGNPNAPIKLIEFASFTCPHCRDFTAEASGEIREMVNTGKLSFELRRYVRDPLDMTMAMLAGCSGKDAYFAMSDQLFGYQETVFQKIQGVSEAQNQALSALPTDKRFNALADATGLVDFVKQRGISEDQARQCLANGKDAEALAQGVQDATAKYNITGTPSFVLNGAIVENTAAWPQLKAKLTEAGL